MKIKRVLLCLAISGLLFSCGGKSDKTEESSTMSLAEFAEAISDEDDGRVISSVDDDEDDEDDDDDSSVSSSSSANWDKLLNEYDAMVDSYIKICKKAQNGDLSAMTEMATYMQKAESFYNRLEKAEDEMTTAQLARLEKIQAKMLKAAQNM